MSDTRSEIIRLGDKFIRERGYNAFSFSDISKELQIRNASVHYYFPTKTDLGIAVVRKQHDDFLTTKNRSLQEDPVKQLKKFLEVYACIHNDAQVCIVGSLTTDLNSIEAPVREELKKLADEILKWVVEILDEGRRKAVFKFSVSSRTKALMIISNMMAALQLSRITDLKDFDLIKNAIIKEIKA